MMAEVVIVGAGLSGLSAAALLVEKGIRPVLIEKSNEVGGLARSVRLEDQSFDIGVHTLYRPSNPAVRHVLEISGARFSERKLNSALWLKGRRISPVAELRNFLGYPIELKLDLLRSFGRRKIIYRTIEERLRATYGKWLYDEFFQPYIEMKIPGYNGGQIHGDWWGLGNMRNEFNVFEARPKPIDGKRIATIVSGLRWWKGFLFGRSNIGLHPPAGIGEIAVGLESYLRERGAVIQLGSSVDKVIIAEGRLSGIRLSDGSLVQTEKLIWSGMLRDLTLLLGIEWPDRLSFISTLAVLLVFRGGTAETRRYLYEYNACSDIFFHRIHYNDYFLRHDDAFGICAEISYTEDHSPPDDDSAISNTVDGLRRLGVIGDERLSSAEVVRVLCSHPLYTLDYRSLLGDVFSKIYEIDGIFPVGRSGAFSNIGMVSSIEMGLNIAAHCAGKR
jgi:protoporphyrinogen oxidase